MSRVDQIAERVARAFANRTSRRSLFAFLGGVLVGGAALPLLPVLRGTKGRDGDSEQEPATSRPTGPRNPQDPGDPTQCEYWRYCAIDGYLCSCCGGGVNICPAGTEMSPLTWIGTCRNPADERQYIISYNDCCGGPKCDRCDCHRNEGDRPITRPWSNNEITWCFGTKSQSYTCSTAIILGVAADTE
ncbi:MAG: methylamine dehydrogenase light chain [Gammaproteobacteria bacterium]